MTALEEIKADEAYWTNFGKKFGLTLIGWSNRDSATFTPDDPKVPGWGALRIDSYSPIFRLLERLEPVDHAVHLEECRRGDLAAGEVIKLRRRANDLEEAIATALKVAEEARREWDAAPNGMKAGKLLIALVDPSLKYRADITRMHALIKGEKS